MVQQVPGLLPHLSVLENVALAAQLRAGLQWREAVGEARRLLEELGVLEVAERRPVELSGGQLQRAALAAALAARPSILLLDEPLSHLDRSIGEKARRLLRGVQRSRRLTVIHVTHDIDEALALGDTLTVLVNGSIHVSGETMQVYQCPGTREAAELLGHSVLPGHILGLDAGLYSVAPDYVSFRPGGGWVVVRVERERGRVVVEARHGGLLVKGYLSPGEWLPRIGDRVEPIVGGEHVCRIAAD